MDQFFDKEIAEASAAISSQHSQSQWYVQAYLIAISGLFAIAGFFAKDAKLTVQASTVGLVYSLVVFFMGWVFLSVIAHKVAMIHMLYKHIAVMRDLRMQNIPGASKNYVLPFGKMHVKYGSLIGHLPYLFFAFNFILFAGSISYFLNPHLQYHQTATLVIATCTCLGTYYPIVCISFNKHLSCAAKANSIKQKQILELHWSKEVEKRKKKHRVLRVTIFTFANLFSIFLAWCAIANQNLISISNNSLILLSYASLIIYAALRFGMEKWRLKIGVEAIRTTNLT